MPWRLSLLTNSALVIRVQMQGEGGVAGSQPMSTAVLITWHGAQINLGDLPPYLTYRFLEINTLLCRGWGREKERFGGTENIFLEGGNVSNFSGKVCSFLPSLTLIPRALQKTLHPLVSHFASLSTYSPTFTHKQTSSSYTATSHIFYPFQHTIPSFTRLQTYHQPEYKKDRPRERKVRYFTAVPFSAGVHFPVWILPAIPCLTVLKGRQLSK